MRTTLEGKRKRVRCGGEGLSHETSFRVPNKGCVWCGPEKQNLHAKGGVHNGTKS